MDVLNTYGGGPEWGAVVLGVAFFGLVVYGVYLIREAVREEEPVFTALGVIVTLVCTMMCVFLVSVKSPIRHEVTLRPGHVIDAAKYEVIEQRGAIYVIEEREQTEAK